MAGERKKQSAGAPIARRGFLGRAIRGGVAAVATGTLSTVASGCRLSVLRRISPSDLGEMTIADLQQKMKSGDLSARALTEMYLARIEEMDKRGPAVNAIIEVNPDALSIADSLDRERREGHVRGPLHGIPILVKDNIATADKMKTTAGSLALVNSKPPRDSFVATRLRDAGAVLLGKTNLSEWANFRSNRSTSGWSGRGGQTRNPYALDRSPGGSSSGSGAAVAANFCAAAVGTETDGSIINPSSANGIVGLKPTVGLVSRSGIIPISHTQDTAGPMARTVADLAALLGALAGFDPNDSATRLNRDKGHSDYTQFLDPNGLRGARIGVARKYFGFHKDVDAVMNAAIEAMKAQGAVIIDPVTVGTGRGMGGSEHEVLLYEFKAGLNKYLAEYAPDAPVRSLKDLIQFNEENKAKEMPFFGQEVFLQAQEKDSLESDEYLKALKECRRLSRDEGIDATLRKDSLDAILAPSGGVACLIDLINGDRFLGGSSSAAAVAGYPSITVPAGYVHGLPVGLSFFAGAFAEPMLIRLAYAFEQATRHRRPPRFLPNSNLGASH